MIGALQSEERLVTFDVGGTVYGLSIADVLEVADVGRLACVPTLPPHLGGVMNHHGEVLPVLARSVLFEVAEAELSPATHLLVLAGSKGEAHGRLGIPVDRILGLAESGAGATGESSGVVERRPIDGRVVSILDTERLVARARSAIERESVRVDNNEETR